MTRTRIYRTDTHIRAVADLSLQSAAYWTITHGTAGMSHRDQYQCAANISPSIRYRFSPSPTLMPLHVRHLPISSLQAYTHATLRTGLSGSGIPVRGQVSTPGPAHPANDRATVSKSSGSFFNESLAFSPKEIFTSTGSGRRGQLCSI